MPDSFACRNSPVNAKCRGSGTVILGCNILIGIISKVEDIIKLQ